MKYLKNVKIVNSLRVLETVFEHTDKVYNYTKLNIGNKINFKQKRKSNKSKETTLKLRQFSPVPREI